MRRTSHTRATYQPAEGRRKCPENRPKTARADPQQRFPAQTVRLMLILWTITARSTEIPTPAATPTASMACNRDPGQAHAIRAAGRETPPRGPRQRPRAPPRPATAPQRKPAQPSPGESRAVNRLRYATDRAEEPGREGKQMASFRDLPPRRATRQPRASNGRRPNRASEARRPRPCRAQGKVAREPPGDPRPARPEAKQGEGREIQGGGCRGELRQTGKAIWHVRATARKGQRERPRGTGADLAAGRARAAGGARQAPAVV